jgi:C1A family cysteine protease
MTRHPVRAIKYHLLILILWSVIPFFAVRAQLPSSFDLRDVDGNNYVTSVKSQSGGTCWAHGTVASMESNLLMNGNWTAAGDTGEPNLAEYHIDWWNGFNNFFNEDVDPPDGNDGLILHEGGDTRITAAYLTRGEGAVRDIDGQSFSDPPERTGPDYHYYYVRDIEWYDAGEDLSNIDSIKYQIMTQGAITTCLNSDYTTYMDDNYVFYQPPDDPQGYDHIVAIVGWDDNKPSAAPYPGAWLCKNSWGDWAIDGYIWISYYDKYCAHSPYDGAVSYYNVVPMPYDKVYYHDYHGWRMTGSYWSEAFNAFMPTNNGKLLAVNIVTASDTAGYTMRIYDDFTGSQLQNLLSEKSGNIAHRGYHTIDLDQPIEVTEGDEFYIYLSVTDGGQAYDMSWRLDITVGGHYRAWADSKANPGESYYKSNSTWHDLYDYNPTANFCIKGLSLDTYMKILQDEIMESEGPSGGPYTPLTKTYQFTHKYDEAIKYSVSPEASCDWITLSGDISGTLEPYDTAEVIVEINSNADTLSTGVHYGAVNFSNIDDPLDDTVRVVKLVVGTPMVQQQWLLDTDPGWSTEGEWEFGQPTGGGGSFGFGADPTSGFTGDNVYGYNLYGNYPNNLPETYLTTPALNCSKLIKTSVKFRRWLCIDGFGWGAVEASNDGENWTTIWECHDWLPDSVWNEMDLDISAVADSQATVYLRWMMTVDNATYTFGGWNIDDIQLVAIYNTLGTDILCGDVNNDEDLNLFDITHLITFLYLGGPPPEPLIKADVNSDGNINIFDIAYIISYLYLGGPAPDCP